MDEIAWGWRPLLLFNDPAGNLLEIADRDLWAGYEASGPPRKTAARPLPRSLRPGARGLKSVSLSHQKATAAH